MSALRPTGRRVGSEGIVAFKSTYFKCFMQLYAECSVSGGSLRTSVGWAGCGGLPEPGPPAAPLGPFLIIFSLPARAFSSFWTSATNGDLLFPL